MLKYRSKNLLTFKGQMSNVEKKRDRRTVKQKK